MFSDGIRTMLMQSLHSDGMPPAAIVDQMLTGQTLARL